MQDKVVLLDIRLCLAVGRCYRPWRVLLVNLHPMPLMLSSESRLALSWRLHSHGLPVVFLIGEDVPLSVDSIVRNPLPSLSRLDVVANER